MGVILQEDFGGAEVSDEERRKRFAEHLRDLARQQALTEYNLTSRGGGKLILEPGAEGGSVAEPAMAGGGSGIGPLGKLSRFVSQTATAAAPGELSDEEAAALGLTSGPAELSDEEAQALGLVQRSAGDEGAGVAAARGAAQGATLNLEDEAMGVIQALGEKAADWIVGDQVVPRDRPAKSFSELYREARDARRNEQAQSAEQHGTAHLLGQLGGGLAPAVLLPGTKTLAGSVASGAGLGAASGFGASNAEDAVGVAKDAGLGALIGGGAGALGHAIGAAPKWAGRRADRLKAVADEAGRAEAGVLTGSARGGAGRAATEAYKNPENIEKALQAGAMTLDDLTPEQLELYRALLRERGLKAAAEMADDAARKTSKAAEYAEAIRTEPQRAAELAAEKLSPKTAGRKFMERVKRYGTPAAIGAIAGNIALPGVGGAVGGAGTALMLRPMLHSLRRLAKDPSVQYPLMRAIEKIGAIPGAAAGPGASAAGRAIAAEAMSPPLMPAYAVSDEERRRLEALVELLEGDRR